MRINRDFGVAAVDEMRQPKLANNRGYLPFGRGSVQSIAQSRPAASRSAGRWANRARDNWPKLMMTTELQVGSPLFVRLGFRADDCADHRCVINGTGQNRERRVPSWRTNPMLQLIEHPESGRTINHLSFKPLGRRATIKETKAQNERARNQLISISCSLNCCRCCLYKYYCCVVTIINNIGRCSGLLISRQDERAASKFFSLSFRFALLLEENVLSAQIGESFSRSKLSSVYFKLLPEARGSVLKLKLKLKWRRQNY